jgi:predicted dinucleotide-binding enzyme
MKEFVAKNCNALLGKIVIDPSNPIAPNGKGGFDKIIPPDQSAGEIIAGLLPPGAKLVKAFGTVAAESLSSGANRKPERAVLFYATAFPEASVVPRTRCPTFATRFRAWVASLDTSWRTAPRAPRPSTRPA